MVLLIVCYVAAFVAGLLIGRWQRRDLHVQDRVFQYPFRADEGGGILDGTGRLVAIVEQGWFEPAHIIRARAEIVAEALNEHWRYGKTTADMNRESLKYLRRNHTS